MDAHTFLRRFVDPTIAEFEAHPSSSRHAFLAAVTTFHCVDYFATPPSKENRIKQYRDESPEFAIVDRVCHAFKHTETGHPNAVVNQPLKVSDVTERPPAFYGVLVLGKSFFNDKVGGVEVEGSHFDFLYIVKRAADFLRNKIKIQTEGAQ